MTLKEEMELERAFELAGKRAASIGIDVTGLSGKSRTSLLQLFSAIDECMADYEKAKQEVSRYKVSPTNLVRYGVPRSTINNNAVLAGIVNYYKEQQDNKYARVKRSQLQSMKQNLEMSGVYQENAIKLGLENQMLRQENEKLRRDLELAQAAFLNASMQGPVRYDFNNMLIQKP